jgi:hypothetical protein
MGHIPRFLDLQLWQELGSDVRKNLAPCLLPRRTTNLINSIALII